MNNTIKNDFLFVKANKNCMIPEYVDNMCRKDYRE